MWKPNVSLFDTTVPSVFAAKNVQAYRDCRQDIKVAEMK